MKARHLLATALALIVFAAPILAADRKANGGRRPKSIREIPGKITETLARVDGPSVLRLRQTAGEIQCRNRLGGLLRHYHRGMMRA